MDDTKTITPTTHRVTLGGEEYEFGQGTTELLERLILISHMNAGATLTLEAATLWLADAAGPTVWQAIMKRFITGEITVNDLMEAMKGIVASIVAAENSAADAA
ncbi:MAG: hypothetical protein K0R62_7133 [Nonomuraea muscovyensis]|jgi:hypothetical protein|nr:hypothetical protein [Nonomuraea muscovyensis]